ncbi:MAG: response regulator [Planctomycetota bacterium]|jgi:DNA-binding response OmpR family regulator
MHVILVVDHDAGTAGFCRMEFERVGDRVVVARDGLEALWQLGRCHIDLMIIDTDAPLVADMKVVEWALIHLYEVPIVIHTNHRARMYELSKWPVEACVRKSQDLAELKHAVRDIFARRWHQKAQLPH